MTAPFVRSVFWWIVFLGLSLPITLAAGPVDAPKEQAADQEFEALLASAQKDPEKADWRAVRRAFAETSFYNPYNEQWRKEIEAVAKSLSDGNLKKSESDLIRLIERERSMRIDAETLAVTLYQRMGVKQKADQHQRLVKCLSNVLFEPGRGLSFEKSIEVLFVDEEYLVLKMLKAKVKSQGLVSRDGHRFDVLTVEADGDTPERTFYFNIDLPYKSLEKMVRGLAEPSKAKPKP